MKKTYFLLLILIGFFGTAQTITISDTNFKTKLLAASSSLSIAKNAFGDNIKIDTNSNGEIEVAEALTVYELNISSPILTTANDIYSVNGIENFTNLKKLNCFGNKISTLTINALTQLEDLKANDNIINTLNISGLSGLKKINLNHNLLTSINISNFVNLTELFIYDNNLTALNFANNPNLTSLNCRQNELTNLDLSLLTALITVVCDTNQLATLNVSGLAHIEEIACSNNLLTTLNLNGLTTLKFLFCDGNNISTLNLNTLSLINWINCSSNPINVINVNGLLTLQYLFISNTLISTLNCSTSGLTKLECYNNPNLTSINIQNGILSASEPDLLFFAVRIANNPLLTSICLDNGEQNNLIYDNYNATGNVVLYSGPTCSTQVFMGVDDYTFNTSMILFPNPATNSISINSADFKTILSVEIFNMLGQKLQSTFYQNSTSVTADISSLNSGTYFVTVSSERGKTTQKFIKI